MKFPFHQSILAIAVAVTFASLAGCGVEEVYHEQDALTADAKSQVETQVKSRPTVQVHEGAWLMGEKIQATRPEPEIYDKQVVFNHPEGMSLPEVALWITENVGVRAVVDASVAAAGPATGTMAIPMSARSTLPSPAFGLPGAASLPALPLAGGAGFGAQPGSPLRFYTGAFRGFLDQADAHYNVWSRYKDGVVTFYTTETRTFQLPSIADTASMNGSISTGDSASGSSQGSSGTGTATAGSAQSTSSGSSGSSGSGGQTITLGVQVTPWQNLERTANAIAGCKDCVVGDKDLGVLTVTGTPVQCDRLENWVKNLDSMYGKQVAIDVHVYQIQETLEHNYGINLSLGYKSSGGHTGVTMTGAAAPLVTSTSTPMTFGASILGGSLSGSSAAVQALATLGNVSQLISRSGVTQNGKLLALQAAKQEGYVASTQSTLTASVGSSTTMQTATLVPGFTSSFLPKVIDGRILIDFDMTLSDLLSLQTFTSGSGSSASSVQLPTLQVTRFEQSVSLKPGETLILTGMRQQNTSTTNNGVGSPYIPLLGGGVDAQKGDTVIAVVISARLL